MVHPWQHYLADTVCSPLDVQEITLYRLKEGSAPQLASPKPVRLQMAGSSTAATPASPLAAPQSQPQTPAAAAAQEESSRETTPL